MKKYIKEIEAIAARCTESQADGYSHIMRICEAMMEEQQNCVGRSYAKTHEKCPMCTDCPDNCPIEQNEF